MKILSEIKDSIYNPIYYRTVRSGSTKAAIGYYYRFTLILALIVTILFAIFFVPLISRGSAFLKNKALALYPTDLEISIKNGRASTNVSEPYFIPLPGEWRRETSQSRDPRVNKLENLLVVNTMGPTDLKKFESYHTAAWLTGDDLVYYRDRGVVVEPLTSFGTLTINHNKVSSWLDAFSPLFTLLAPLAVLGAFILAMIGVSFYLLVLMLVAFLTMLVGYFKQIRLDYWQAYRVTLHAATLPFLLRIFTGVLFPTIGLHFLPTLILLCVVAFNLKTEAELLAQA